MLNLLIPRSFSKHQLNLIINSLSNPLRLRLHNTRVLLLSLHHYIFLCCPESDLQGRTQQPFNLETWIESHPQYRGYLERLPRPAQDDLAWPDLVLGFYDAVLACDQPARHLEHPRHGLGAAAAGGGLEVAAVERHPAGRAMARSRATPRMPTLERRWSIARR